MAAPHIATFLSNSELTILFICQRKELRAFSLMIRPPFCLRNCEHLKTISGFVVIDLFLMYEGGKFKMAVNSAKRPWKYWLRIWG